MNLGRSVNFDFTKYKNNIISIAIVILTLIIAGNIYKSQAKTERSLKGEKEIEQKENAVLADIAGLQKRINSYKQVLHRKDISGLMNNINNIARETGVKIVSVRPQPEKDYPVYTKYYFELTVGVKDYHQIGKFIDRIENSSDIYIVESLDLRPSPINRGETREDSELVAVLTLSIIFFKG